MSGDSVSAVISISPQASIVRYLVQSLFIVSLAALSAFSILLDYGNKELWTMILVLTISQMLNLPLVDIVSLITERPKKANPVNL